MNDDEILMRSSKELCLKKRKGFRTEPYRVPILKISPPKRPRKKGHRGYTSITETGVVECQEKRSDW